MHKLVYAFHRASDYTDELINMSISDAAVREHHEYLGILDDMMNILFDYKSVVVIDSSGRLNPAVDNELDDLSRRCQDNQYRLQGFKKDLNETEKERLEAARQNDIRNQIRQRFQYLDSTALHYVVKGEIGFLITAKNQNDEADYSNIIVDYSKCIEYLLTKELRNRGKLAEEDVATLGTSYFKYVKPDIRHWHKGFPKLLVALKDIRNRAAHPSNMGSTYHEAELVRSYILGNETHPEWFEDFPDFQKGMLSYLNRLMKKDGRIMP